MHPKGEPPLPGSIEDTEPDVPQPTMLVPGPMQAHEVACSQKFEKAGKAAKSWPPALARDGWEQFQNRKLPGDDLVCLRYRTQRNWKWAVFVPSLVLSMITDSPVLCHETRREQVVDGNQTRLECTMGQPATDLFTKDSVCPVVCGFSNMHWTPIWYSLFLATVVYCSFRGRWVDADRYWARKASNIAKYIGCWRAGYSDRHLQVIFILLTLCAVHSVLVRFAATPEVGGFDNACVRYGDWDGVEDVCKPGPLLLPGILGRQHPCSKHPRLDRVPLVEPTPELFRDRSLLGTGLASVFADLLPVFLRCIVGPGCHRHEAASWLPSEVFAIKGGVLEMTSTVFRGPYALASETVIQ